MICKTIAYCLKKEFCNTTKVLWERSIFNQNTFCIREWVHIRRASEKKRFAHRTVFLKVFFNQIYFLNLKWIHIRRAREKKVCTSNGFSKSIHQFHSWTKVDSRLNRPIVSIQLSQAWSYEKISHATHQELVWYWLQKAFHLHCEYFHITRMFWQYHKDKA